MAKARRKKKTGAGAYALFLAVWILLLAGLSYLILKDVWKVAEYWEAAEVNPVLDAYMEDLRSNMWENGVADTISAMPHEFQTDEECVQVLREVLKDEIRYVVSTGKSGDNRRYYDLLCGDSKFGQVVLAQDVQLPEDEDALVRACIDKFYLYPWHVESEEFFFDGLYSTFEITVPEQFKVQLNGRELSEDYIVERGIHYDVLEPYYASYDGLPTKVTYRVETILGHVDYQLLDASGQPTEIDPDRDDSQFIEPVSEEKIERFRVFAYEFSSRFLEFSAGTTDMQWLYDRLNPYIARGSELEDRVLRAMDSYVGWQHNSRFRMGTMKLNGVTYLGNNIYVVDLTATASAYQPRGPVEVERNMRVFAYYDVDKDWLRAFTEEDY